MAAQRVAIPRGSVWNGVRATENVFARFNPCLVRTMATEASPAPLKDATSAASNAPPPATQSPSILGLSTSAPEVDTPRTASPSIRPRAQNPFLGTAQCTLHSFPSLEPTGFHLYPSAHLLLPLRKDILHKAVIFEGDRTRQGTANTKWRSEVHGSGRKVRPQKGTGSARLGDKKSPMLRGGGVAFGPKPRDFSTDLPRKVYHLAWRTALSYRFKLGQITVVDDNIDLDLESHEGSRESYVRQLLLWNKFYNGGALFITNKRRNLFFDTVESERLSRAKALTKEDVDVKDLLKRAHLVIEKRALDWILWRHQTDVPENQRLEEPEEELELLGLEGLQA